MMPGCQSPPSVFAFAIRAVDRTNIIAVDGARELFVVGTRGTDDAKDVPIPIDKWPAAEAGLIFSILILRRQ